MPGEQGLYNCGNRETMETMGPSRKARHRLHCGPRSPRAFRAEAVFQVLKGPTATRSSRNKCGKHTLAGADAGTQPPTGAGTKAPHAPGTKVAMDSGAFLHRARQLPMNTGAVSTDCLKHLAWVQLISRSKGLALISQKGWIGSEGSASQPQLLQQ